MARAYIALGSNLGDRAANLNAALTALGSSRGVRVLEHSSFHETAPVGGPPGQSKYLNAAAVLETSLDPKSLLQLMLDIEKQLGRVRGEKDAPRTIDLDFLMHDEVPCHHEDPILPHPRMAEREFVLAPLAEIAPTAFHVSTGSEIRDLLMRVRGHLPTPFRLDGMRAFVTGASGGIGQATAMSLSINGADIIVHGRDESRIHNCEHFDRRIHHIVGDFRDAARVEQIAMESWEHWNGLDILVNIAGADILTGEGKDWSFEQKLESLWTVDVQATMTLSRIIGECMKARGRGVIINIGWDQAETGMEGESGQLFAATKGAVMAFTRSLAKTLAPEVRVNCVAPGWIKTAWGNFASDEWQQRVLRETPLQRWGTPSDVANAIAWLASPAAAFVTGQIIRVNGGAV